ncbi:MAG: NAD(P)-binding domain-containing protein [Proteobacteria bacterium]|jgi:8-hydroxy-5-deazaflavin:NADPH oxidoreductase|nr:NAD(P)-binding domain-containing protein [Pseudomonadota bacterium]
MITSTYRRALMLFSIMIGLVVAGPLSADTIAIIGTGNVGGALGPEFAAQGHTIVYGSRDPDRAEVQELVASTSGDASATSMMSAAANADIVVIAVPGGVAEELVSGLGDLSGKIIIDPTNRVAPGEDGFMNHTAETSNAELIQAAAPNAQVVKAFNTLNYRTMIDPGGPVTIPLAGDSLEAKATVAMLVEGMGLEAVDVGPLRSSHVLEGMLTIWINASRADQPFDYHFRRK